MISLQKLYLPKLAPIYYFQIYFISKNVLSQYKNVIKQLALIICQTKIQEKNIKLSRITSKMILNSLGMIQSKTKPISQQHFRLPKRIINDFLDADFKYSILEEDEDFLYRVLIEVLKYPDKKLAQLHKSCNKLGKNDLKSQIMQNEENNNDQVKNFMNDSNQNLQVSQQQFMHSHETLPQYTKKGQQFCSCCGFVKQKQEISVCQDFQQFPIIGLSTFLYFKTVHNISILLLILLLIYGFYSIFVNYYITIKTEGYQVLTGLILIESRYQTIFSHKSFQLNYSKQTADITNFSRIEAILIVVVVIVWSICAYVFKHYEIQHEYMIDGESITASDFSIMIQNAPIQLFKDKACIVKQFDNYFKQIQPHIQKQFFQVYIEKGENQPFQIKYQQQLKSLKISKINIGIPFYLNPSNLETDKQYQKLQERLQEYQQRLVQWIQQFFQKNKFSVDKNKRQHLLKGYKQIQERIKIKKQNFLNNLEIRYRQSTPEQLTTTAFITFQSAIAAKIVYDLNPSDFLSKIHYYLTCCSRQNFLSLKNKKGEDLSVKITRAPQPQDIKWQNIGFSFWLIFSRKLFIYLLTFIILAGSYWLITYFSDIQIRSTSQIISIVISLSISLFNVGIGQLICKITIFQRDFTETNHQASLALKAIVAQLINTIFIPLMVKRNNIYGEKGLVQDVFFLAITNALIGPFLKTIDPYYHLTRIIFWYKAKPNNRIGLTQVELNGFAEQVEFQVGYQYIYVTNLFLISCFYTPLQPIIPIISVIGLFLMYWTQKYSLLNRMRRPVPGSDIINVTVSQILNLGPMVLATGALVFSEIFTLNKEKQLKFLLHLISIALGFFFYFLPFKIIYRFIFSNDQKFENLNYFQNRVLLPSEYDRANPATTHEGMNDFVNYLKQLNNVMSNNDNNNLRQSSNRIADNLASLFQRLSHNPHSKLNESIKNVNNESNELLNSLFFNLGNVESIRGTAPGSKIRSTERGKIALASNLFQNLIKNDQTKRSLLKNQSNVNKEAEFLKIPRKIEQQSNNLRYKKDKSINRGQKSMVVESIRQNQQDLRFTNQSYDNQVQKKTKINALDMLLNLNKKNQNSPQKHEDNLSRNKSFDRKSKKQDLELNKSQLQNNAEDNLRKRRKIKKQQGSNQNNSRNNLQYYGDKKFQQQY